MDQQYSSEGLTAVRYRLYIFLEEAAWSLSGSEAVDRVKRFYLCRLKNGIIINDLM